jgi:hypothetical protein
MCSSREVVQMSMMRLMAVAPVLSVVLACTVTDTTNNPPPQPAAPATTSPAPTAPPKAPVADAGAPPEADTGLVTQFVVQGQGPQNIAGIEPMRPGICTQTTNDGCIMQDCLFAPGDNAGPPRPAAYKEVDLGAVTITSSSTTFPEGAVLEVNSSTGKYSDKSVRVTPPASPPAWFDTGDSVTFHAAGGADLGAYEVMLKAPASIKVTSPTAVAMGGPPSMTISSSQALDVAWEPGSGKVGVTLGGTTPAGRALVIQCTFDASAGKGQVPASLMAKLAQAKDGSFSAGAVSLSTMHQGHYEITTVISNAASGVGSNAVTYQ